LGAADSLSVTFCQSWRYDDAPARLAERLGLGPGQRYYSDIGGVTGISLLSQASEAIVDGRLELAVLCGAEALGAVKAAMLSGQELPWSFPHPEGTMYFPSVDLHPGELSSGAAANAPLAFSLWDSARRAHLGIGLDAYRREMAETLAGMTTVAARNPHAWFPVEHDADFLLTPTATNRMVAYPYTKHMVAFMDVNMASAVIVASTATADRLGVPIERRVHPRGWCQADSPAYAAQQHDLWKLPPMAAASREALSCAGLGIDEITHLDLYSCFPSAVNTARDALGVVDRPGARLTVTGGLPYAGGPGSNYGLHSLAAMTDVLRDDSGSCGLVSGLGMLMGEHAFCVLGPPPAAPPPPPKRSAVQAHLDQVPPRQIVENYSGVATVAAYSVAHDRVGPSQGLAICDLPDHARAYVRFDDPDLMADCETTELVGRTVHLAGAGSHSIIQT
jgi:acetyl-CoA C-acetyltransferase